MKTNLKKMGWGLLTGLALVLAVISCRKDDSSSSLPPDSPEANKLKEWYQSKMNVSGENPFGKMKPRWNSLYVNENSSQRVYEVELENPERVLAKLGRPDRSTLGREEKRHMIRLLIFENRLTSKILYASYMSVESGAGVVSKDFHYKRVGAFSGTVLFYHFGGVLSNGWDYENGKITRQITAISKSDFDLLSQSGPKGKLMAQVTTCTSGFAEKYKWSCVGVSGYENCGWTSAGTEYVTVCTTREASDEPTPDDGGPSGTGDYIPPIYIDCAGVEDGSAYWNSECKTCMGGTTGINECPDITDRINNPCLKNVWDAIKSNTENKITDLLHSTFGQNHTINFKIVDGNIDGGGPAKSAVTKNILSSTGERFFDVKVTLNKNTMPGYSQEYVATTIVHEIMHAYFNENRTFYNQQFQQHQAMAEGYVEHLKDAVTSLFPNMPDKAAYALVLNGFNDMFEQNLTGWNALLTKYQLTNQEIYDTQSAYKSNNPSAPGTKCPSTP